MEYLDIYDENKNYLGKEERGKVHTDALWHNTVHCWLYDKEGNIYFQIREDSKTFYTTASGHVMAGESIKEAFGREIKEEIGIDVDYEKAVLVDTVKFILDRKNKDGSYFRDRAFANVYVLEFNDDMTKFNYDEIELDGIVKVKASSALDLFNNKLAKIDAYIYKNKVGIKKEKVSKKDFLVNPGETLPQKYSEVLTKVINLTNC